MQDIAIDIVQKASQGDLKAFEELYRLSCGFVYSCALRIVNNAQDAEEITQEVFIKIHKNLSQFEFRSKFKTWMYRITMNTAINYVKKIQKEPGVSGRDNQDIIDGQADKRSDAIEAGDNQKLVMELLDQLNADQKACMILREIEGLRYEEIALALNININTVRSRLKRAREILMQLPLSEAVKNEL